VKEEEGNRNQAHQGESIVFDLKGSIRLTLPVKRVNSICDSKGSRKGGGGAAGSGSKRENPRRGKINSPRFAGHQDCVPRTKQKRGNGVVKGEVDQYQRIWGITHRQALIKRSHMGVQNVWGRGLKRGKGQRHGSLT